MAALKSLSGNSSISVILVLASIACLLKFSLMSSSLRVTRDFLLKTGLFKNFETLDLIESSSFKWLLTPLQQEMGEHLLITAR